MPVGDALWGSPDQLLNTSKQAMNSVSNLNGFIQRTETQVQALMARWQGSAPPLFQQQHQQWRTDMTALTKELERVSVATQKAAQHQTQADEQSKQAMSRPVSDGLKL
jgi:WXG100 family type VII secretion target